jgi:UDP-N-acetylglucosamine 2-epimerase (non-hydrolysing)
MKKFEDVLLQEKPQVLVVVGDVNSTLACALVAAKISFDDVGSRPLIAHVEAGLRSFDRTMPEETNRILTDHLSDLLFVTEESGLVNLAKEGIASDKIHFVGNTMIDSLLEHKEKADTSTILSDLGLRPGTTSSGSWPAAIPFGLLTLHRPANVDNREAFLNILQGLDEMATQYPIIFPAHPRTQKRIVDLGLEGYFLARPRQQRVEGSHVSDGTPGIRIVDPLGYLDFLCLMKNAMLVVTDSGGIQEETTCLGVPCVTVRENTERPVTVEIGTNVLAGVQSDGIRKAIQRQLTSKAPGIAPEGWDGKCSARIIAILTTVLQTTTDHATILA